NQANKSAGLKEANYSAGTKANDDEDANSEEIDLHDGHFVLPIWSAYSTSVKSLMDKFGKNVKPVSQVEQIFQEELEMLKRQEKKANDGHEEHLESTLSQPQGTLNNDVPKSSGNSNPTTTSTNSSADQLGTLIVETPIPTDSSPVLTAFFSDSQEPSSETRLISKMVTNQVETPSLDNILTLTNQFEDILGDTSNSEESNGVEADEELLQCKIQKVWSLADCPKGVRPIGTKWVLKNKKDERGIVVRNKSRLVAQGHTQDEGIDYDEVFAPVARIEAIRLFLAYASFMSFKVYQMDVKSAFLYGTIDEEVHQVTPKEYHLHAVKRIFRYLKGHPKLGIWYPKDSPFDLVA
nr:retrovirus-related Pol polyprotein from transposon TNT 1-94 [Tanacetum cinerariifolium]